MSSRRTFRTVLRVICRTCALFRNTRLDKLGGWIHLRSAADCRRLHPRTSWSRCARLSNKVRSRSPSCAPAGSGIARSPCGFATGNCIGCTAGSTRSATPASPAGPVHGGGARVRRPRVRELVRGGDAPRATAVGGAHSRRDRRRHQGAARRGHQRASRTLAALARRHAPPRDTGDLARAHAARPRHRAVARGAAHRCAPRAGRTPGERPPAAALHRAFERASRDGRAPRRHRRRAGAHAQHPRGSPARPPRPRRRRAARDQRAAARRRPHDHPRLRLARAAPRHRGRQRALARAQAHARERGGDDADKQAILEARGWRVLRIDDQQLRRHPGQTLARIRAALAEATHAAATP